MKHTEGNFKGVRSTNIYYQGWLPDEDVKAVLLIVHGLGEHSGRYKNVVEHFVPLGYAVYGFDHIGHGKSEGDREYVEIFEDFTDNLMVYYNMVKVWQKGIPIFLLGHSMGGLIVPYYLISHQEKFKGAVISAPFVKIGDNISQMTIIMGKILSNILPRAGVQALDPAGVSSDPQVVADYVNDPLVFHGKTPARLAAELLRAIQHVNQNFNKITLPFIVLQGGSDALIDLEGAQNLYDQASSIDKTIKIYEGLHHEVFNEPEREIVLKDCRKLA